MKKILTLLTGIVFIITILVAGGCGNADRQNKAASTGDDPGVTETDTTRVEIYLKAILLDGSMHLEMYDSKKPKCEVVDNLVTVVYPGYTVSWKKATDSEIDEVLYIRPVKENGGIFPEDAMEDKGLFKLIIPPNAPYDSIEKYEIVFKAKKDTTTWIIDPYLRIPYR